jgi:hypothetical protein
VILLQSLSAADNFVRRRCLTLASNIVSVDNEGHCGHPAVGDQPVETLTERNAPTVQFVPNTNAYLLLHQRVHECGQEFVEMSFSLHGDCPVPGWNGSAPAALSGSTMSGMGASGVKYLV